MERELTKLTKRAYEHLYKGYLMLYHYPTAHGAEPRIYEVTQMHNGRVWGVWRDDISTERWWFLNRDKE